MDHPTVRAKAKLIALAVGSTRASSKTGATRWNARPRRRWSYSRQRRPRRLAKAWQLLGYVHGNACRFAETAAAFERAVEHARLAGDAKLEARCATQYALALVYGPTPARDAIKECERIVAQVSNDRQAQANILSCLASLEGMLGEIDAARQHYAQARMLLEDLGLMGPAASMSLQTGRVETLAGDLQAAESEFRRGYDGLEQLGERYFRSTVASLLAGVLYEDGRYEEAESFRRIGAGSRRRTTSERRHSSTRCTQSFRPGKGGAEAEALVAEALEPPLDHRLHRSAGRGAARPGRGAQVDRPYRRREWHSRRRSAWPRPSKRFPTRTGHEPCWNHSRGGGAGREPSARLTGPPIANDLLPTASDVAILVVAEADPHLVCTNKLREHARHVHAQICGRTRRRRSRSESPMMRILAAGGAAGRERDRLTAWLVEIWNVLSVAEAFTT